MGSARFCFPMPHPKQEQLDVIEAAPRIMVAKQAEQAAGGEVMPPDQATASVGDSRRARSRGGSSLG